MLEEVPGAVEKKNNGVARASLQKEFTLTSGVAVIVGQVIGSGIFITPKSILHYGGSFGVCILMWVAGAFVSVAGGLCYIELGLLVKRGGGESGYLTEAYSLKNKNKWSELFGSMLGFLFVWSNVCILRPASLAIQSLTCARYLTRPLYGDAAVPEYLVKLVALTALGKLTIERVNKSCNYKPGFQRESSHCIDCPFPFMWWGSKHTWVKCDKLVPIGMFGNYGPCNS